MAPRPAAAAALRSPRVIDLGYADNAGLCGLTPEELQQLIDCYCDYCGENGLLVIPAKCETMVFGNGSAGPGRRRWTLPAAGGRRTAMTVVTKFKYLGVELHGNGDITRATGHRHNCMVAAQLS